MNAPTAGTRLVVLLGNPVAQSRSPAMQNAAFKALGLDFVFETRLVEHDRVGEAVQALRASNAAGANVTMPHKGAVMPHLDEISARARSVAAVNTIVHRDGRLVGDNTDGIGFLRSVKEDLDFDVKGRRCVVLGAGGVARAIVAALSDAEVEGITILNRTLERAEQLRRALGDAVRCPCETAAMADEDACVEALAEADLTVNCTSVGMHDDATPVDTEWLNPTGALYDTIYTHDTALVRGALGRSIAAVTGAGMLVHQGAEAFAQWTGVAAPVDVMRAALDAALATAP